MKNTLETRLGIFFAVAILAAVAILELAGGLEYFKKGYRIHALFTTVQELKMDDPVKLAGKPIGRVEDIEWADGKIKVTLKIDDRKAPIKTDSKAMVKFTGLLGQNFVSLDFGTPTGLPIAPGAVLESKEQPDLSSLMAKLEGVASGVENLTKTFSTDSFKDVLGPFTDFLKENNPKLTAILGNMQTISSQISEGKGTIGKLIQDETLYQRATDAVSGLSSTTEEIKTTLDQAKSVVADINAGKGTLGKLAKDEALYNETTTAMTNLREILQKINQGEGSVGKLVNDEALYKNAKMTLQKVEKATEGLEDQGPLSVLGIAVNSLF
ncbi:MAG: MCE family protein [Verrucomicrobia bacterium]|nr:MCE family protein [Verrucomicrobiota bacterium]